MATKIIMPEMGEGVIEGTISQWLKAEGDTVDQYEPILEIETDKVTTEATAEVGGVLLKQCVQPGDVVPVGTVLAYVGQAGESVAGESGETAVSDTPDTTPQPSTPPAPVAIDDNSVMRQTPKPYTGRISPVVSRIAAEHQVDLSMVRGSGKDERITKKDILAYIDLRQQQPAPVAPKSEPAQPAPVAQSAPASTTPVMQSTPRPAPVPTAPVGETVPLSNMRRSIADHMVRSKHTSPHVTTVFEFDFTAVAKHRAAHKAEFAQAGLRLTFTAYMVSAVASALRKHPMVNSSWTEKGIHLKQDINVGMAAAISEGLIVPVIKHADEMNLRGLARVVNDLTVRARDSKLGPADVQGGTFTITNHGTSGSLFATPIINQPQCGILGVGKIEKRVKVIGDAIAIRPMAYVGLTFDHRILDGATADAFVATIKDTIENWA